MGSHQKVITHFSEYSYNLPIMTSLQQSIYIVFKFYTVSKEL